MVTMSSTVLLILCVFVGNVYCGSVSYQFAQGCKDKEMDIFFVMDSSSSLQHVEYQKVLEFVRNVVTRLDIGEEKTRVGAIAYSLKVNMQPHPLGLKNFTNEFDIMSYIKEDNFPFISSITSTDDAIKYVRENPEFRQHVTKVIVVITDGGSRDPQSTSRQAEHARAEGFYLFVIGVGQYHDESEWQAIATDPDARFIYNITNFQQLRAIQASLARRACSLLPLKTCDGTGVFATLVYISGSVGTLNLTYQISDSFVDSVYGDHSDINLGFFIQNCWTSIIPFERTDYACPSRKTKSTHEMNVSGVIDVAEKEASESVSERGDHNQVFVIVIDDNSIEHISENQIRTLVEEKSLEIILVDVTSEGVEQVRESVGIPSNYVRIIPGTIQLEQSLGMLNRLTCEAIKRQEDGYINPGVN